MPFCRMLYMLPNVAPRKAKNYKSVIYQQFDTSGLLDYQWVIRWLDDVGLPQYKDRFLEARLDGRMLHLLTVTDLFQVSML
jgi:hypothetical protein